MKLFYSFKRSFQLGDKKFRVIYTLRTKRNSNQFHSRDRRQEKDQSRTTIHCCRKRNTFKPPYGKLCPKGSRLAHLHGLPKTHKPQLSMRPILSATGTYNFLLAKWLDERLKPLSMNKFTIMDPLKFVEEVRSEKVDAEEILVSYDVTSLFTNVPVDETIKILVERAFKNNWCNKPYKLKLKKSDLETLLNLAVKHQLFQFDSNLYEQVDGVAMGSPLGPLLANTFMCSLEERLVK